MLNKPSDASGKRLVEPCAEVPVIETLARVCALCNEAKIVMNEVRTFIDPNSSLDKVSDVVFLIDHSHICQYR